LCLKLIDIELIFLLISKDFLGKFEKSHQRFRGHGRGAGENVHIIYQQPSAGHVVKRGLSIIEDTRLMGERLEVAL